MLVPVTMPVAVLRGLVHDRFGVSELETSLFMSINMIGAALAAPVMGLLLDRLERRKPVIVWATLIDAALFWAMTEAPTFGALLSLRFVEGIAHIVALSALLALAGDSRLGRGRAMGTAGTGITFGVGIGAPLGGVIGRTDPVAPLAAGAVVLLFVALAAAMLLPESAERRSRASFAEMVAAVRRHRALVVPLVFAFVDRFTTGFFTTTFSLYLRRVFELDPPRIGLLIALFMLPFSLLSYPAGRLADRWSRTALMCGGSLVYGLATASLGWWSEGLLPVLMVVLGTSAAVMFVPSLVMTADLSASETRATGIAAFNAAGALGFIAGPVTGGWISQTVAAGATWVEGYRAAFVVAGVSELLCVLLFLPWLLRLRRQGLTT